MNQLMNDEAVYRTAPATPGLLISWHQTLIVLNTSLIIVFTLHTIANLLCHAMPCYAMLCHAMYYAMCHVLYSAI